MREGSDHVSSVRMLENESRSNFKNHEQFDTDQNNSKSCQLSTPSSNVLGGAQSPHPSTPTAVTPDNVIKEDAIRAPLFLPRQANHGIVQPSKMCIMLFVFRCLSASLFTTRESCSEEKEEARRSFWAD